MSEATEADERSVAIVLECDLDAPVERVWRALTVSDIVAAWLMPNDMQLGARPDFTLQGAPEDGGTIRCDLLASDPPRRLSYSWRIDGRDDAAGPLDSVVTFELAPLPAGGTRLRIEHGGFVAKADTVVDRIIERETVIVLLPLDAIARRRIRRPRPSILSRHALPTRMRLAA